MTSSIEPPRATRRWRQPLGLIWRSKAALGEMAFVREFSQSLADGWSQVGGMVETILEETTDLQKVRVTTPAGTAGRRFVRLRVTRL